MATQLEMINWAKAQENKWIDVDGAYGAQCVDLAMKYCQVFGGMIPHGNAIDYLSNAIPSGSNIARTSWGMRTVARKLKLRIKKQGRTE